MSEFAIDTKRICASKGHDWTTPHPRSSFYDNPNNRQHRVCERCGVWEGTNQTQGEVRLNPDDNKRTDNE